jgi:O-acetyl-ADP-ribose deacetylase (regulator of RNase III)
MKMQGSLNQAVMAAAGEKLDEFIVENIYKPRAGDAFAVPGFNLPVKHIIYAVTPLWKSGFSGEDRDLLHCYRRAMELVWRMGLKSVAFPALGTGKDKFPVPRAARLGIQGIMERMTPKIDEVRIVCSRDDTYKAFEERLAHEGAKG